MSLCFYDAIAKERLPAEATLKKEALQQMLAHFKGVRHPEDGATHDPHEDELMDREPWVLSLRHVALTSTYTPLEDISEYLVFFQACHSGNIEAFKTSLEAIQSRSSVPNPLQPAACLAAQRQQHDILRLCFRTGAVFDEYLSSAAKLGAETDEMLQLLLEENWEGIKNSQGAVKRQIEIFGENSWQAKWLKDNGGIAANNDIEEGFTVYADGTRKEASGKKSNKKGRDPTKGTGSRDPNQGLSPEQIQEWFGDVDW